MDVCQLVPELRVSLIAINQERKILLYPSTRWNNFLTVPGESIRHSDEELKTLEKLLENHSLTLINEPAFLGREIAINPHQFYLSNAHLVFLEYECKVEEKPRTGEFLDPYKILTHSEDYYNGSKSDLDFSSIVEEITYRTLTKFVKNNHPK